MDIWIEDRSECQGLEDIYNISLPVIRVKMVYIIVYKEERKKFYPSIFLCETKWENNTIVLMIILCSSLSNPFLHVSSSVWASEC